MIKKKIRNMHNMKHNCKLEGVIPMHGDTLSFVSCIRWGWNRCPPNPVW